jgi:hypothetical protein
MKTCQTEAQMCCFQLPHNCSISIDHINIPRVRALQPHILYAGRYYKTSCNVEIFRNPILNRTATVVYKRKRNDSIHRHVYSMR